MGDTFKPLTKEMLEKYQARMKEDPKLIKELLDHYKNLGDSIVSEDLKKEIVSEASEKMKQAIVKLPSKDKKLIQTLNESRPIKVSVKLDRQKNTKEVKY